MKDLEINTPLATLDGELYSNAIVLFSDENSTQFLTDFGNVCTLNNRELAMCFKVPIWHTAEVDAFPEGFALRTAKERAEEQIDLLISFIISTEEECSC